MEEVWIDRVSLVTTISRANVRLEVSGSRGIEKLLTTLHVAVGGMAIRRLVVL